MNTIEIILSVLITTNIFFIVRTHLRVNKLFKHRKKDKKKLNKISNYVDALDVDEDLENEEVEWFDPENHSFKEVPYVKPNFNGREGVIPTDFLQSMGKIRDAIISKHNEIREKQKQPILSIQQFCENVEASKHDIDLLTELNNYLISNKKNYSIVHLEYMVDFLEEKINKLINKK